MVDVMFVILTIDRYSQFPGADKFEHRIILSFPDLNTFTTHTAASSYARWL